MATNRHETIGERDASEAARKVAARRVATTGDVAAIVRVASRTVSKWIDGGRLKGYKIPGSLDRRVPIADLVDFLRESNIPIPRELVPPARVVYGLALPEPYPGWDVCDAFQLGGLCAARPVEVAVIGDDWGLTAARGAAACVRQANPAALLVFVVDPAHAAESLPGEVRVRGEVELGELLGAL